MQRCKVISCRKVIITTIELHHRISFANVYFVKFEQVNIYLHKSEVLSSKLFDSFILIYGGKMMGYGYDN